MKILHTGDWHIGKLVHGVHMTFDQAKILNELILFIENEQPDVVLIAGDVYDRAIPPVEAVELLDKTLTKIVLEMGIPTIIISGNHDNPERLSFGNQMLESIGLHIFGVYDGKIEPVIIKDAYGEVAFYPIPFVEPIIVREIHGDGNIITHEDAMKAIIDRVYLDMNLARRNVCIAHGLIIGETDPIESESERIISIGGTGAMGSQLFHLFDYTALGHLHQPQRSGDDYIRYAGSLLKYSFSEELQRKSITMVELGEKGRKSYRLESLKPLRDMRKITGFLNDLIDVNVDSEGCDDYVMVVLADQGELIDPMAALRFVYPNILRLERIGREGISQSKGTVPGDEFIKVDPIVLFSDFFENMTEEPLSDEEKSEVVRVIDELIVQKGDKI